MTDLIITGIETEDIRFSASENLDRSNAINHRQMG